MYKQNKYRTHLCNELRETHIGSAVRISGWVENIRDHGGVTFLDIRDEHGIVQVVVNDESILKEVNKESCICVSGKVVLRSADTINLKIETGTVEIVAQNIEVIGKCTEALPFDIPYSTDTKEEIRLKYRFLDLRNKKVHKNILLRSKIISYLRNQMESLGFTELQTPILSSSSPEGARDYLIPSRKHKGKFYALPQAPQIFKQLLMVSGFDRYFQIAPCFRDEDARADRSPGEFYQLDFEMAFATQEDVFEIAEKKVSKPPFKRITYKESMLKYGTDKPDLRNPLEIIDISDLFVDSSFLPFKNKTVRAIALQGGTNQSKGFFEKMLQFALSIGMKGLGYIKVNSDMSFCGPINKFLSDENRIELINRANLKVSDVLFFIADSEKRALLYAGQIRTELAKRLNDDIVEMCFITDFPMYERDDNGKIIFSHNPFSMPQGGLKALQNENPENILAYQYDLVCNGVELSSGAVRNHDLEIMKKAFQIAGYSENDLKNKFSALYNAFKFGAPPHAGMAPGIDRLVMLITGQENIREIIAFPMNSNAQDIITGAPGEVDEQQLRDIHIKIR